MADAVVLDTWGKFDVLASETLDFLDLIYFDGTDWQVANSDTASLAEIASAVVVTPSGAAAGETCQAALMALVYDADAPYTEQAEYYLTAAGSFSTTKDSDSGDAPQIVGKGVSDSLLYLYPGIELDEAAAVVANS
jgi:hypothetical protein